MFNDKSFKDTVVSMVPAVLKPGKKEMQVTHQTDIIKQVKELTDAMVKKAEDFPVHEL